MASTRSSQKKEQVPPDLSKKVLIRAGDRFNTIIYAHADEYVKRKFLETQDAAADIK